MAGDRHDEDGPVTGDPGWLPFLGGLIGMVAGAALGYWVGIDDGTGNARTLAVVGGFMGMVLVVVPINSRLRKQAEAAEGTQTRRGSQWPPWRSRSAAVARVPAGGLPTRSVPNRNAEPSGHIDGGAVVRVARRSGNWARIESADEEPVWLDRRLLEPAD